MRTCRYLLEFNVILPKLRYPLDSMYKTVMAVVNSGIDSQ